MLPSNLLWFCSLILVFTTAISVQNDYDSNCTSTTSVSSSNYQCNFTGSSCQAFIVYRAQKDYNTLASIAALFNSRTDSILSYNNLSQVDPNLLQMGYEIIIPTTCSCSEDGFYRADYGYNASSHSGSLSTIACGTFEGLVTARNLGVYNPYFQGDNQNISSIQVPLKCSCPNTSDVENIGIAFLATYPILEHDTLDLIGLKFHVAEETIRVANRLGPFDAIFPQTTLLIPLTKQPYLNFDLVSSPPDKQPSPQVLIPSRSNKESKTKNYFVIFGALVCAIILFMVTMYAATIFLWNKNRQGIVKSLPKIGPRPSKFSRDFLDGMTKLKHSFNYFSLEELMIATGNFNECSLISAGVFRGKFGDTDLAIKQISSREVANNIICILTKINHLNVVKLEGYYDGAPAFLVFELAENGSLRECLSSSKFAKELTWSRRIQIAFDLAEGLHYLHYSTKPTYVHRNINSRNVLITADWRAKISGFGSAKPLNENEEKGESNWKESAVVNREGYLAPEYLKYGQASIKVDVYAFGVVLLEILSAKEATTNGPLLKNFIKSSTTREFHQDSSSYLKSLEQFIDPLLERDYPVDDVLYLACLAKGCMEEEPLKRPTMNDVLMALSRML